MEFWYYRVSLKFLCEKWPSLQVCVNHVKWVFGVTAWQGLVYFPALKSMVLLCWHENCETRKNRFTFSTEYNLIQQMLILKIGVGFVKEALISERKLDLGTWHAVKDVGPAYVCISWRKAVWSIWLHFHFICVFGLALRSMCCMVSSWKPLACAWVMRTCACLWSHPPARGPGWRSHLLGTWEHMPAAPLPSHPVSAEAGTPWLNLSLWSVLLVMSIRRQFRAVSFQAKFMNPRLIREILCSWVHFCSAPLFSGWGSEAFWGAENFPPCHGRWRQGGQEACSPDSSFLSVSDNFDMTGIVDSVRCLITVWNFLALRWNHRPPWIVSPTCLALMFRLGLPPPNW